MTTDNHNRPLSRAERLKSEALESASTVSSRDSAPPTGKPGARARALNRRITQVLREQEAETYGVTGEKEQSPTVAGSSSASWEDIANEVVPDSSTGERTHGGLATGAMRGPSRRNPAAQTRPAHATWLAEPNNPGVIPCPIPAVDVLLHDALRGVEYRCQEHGTHYLISRAATEFDAAFGSLQSRLAHVLERETFPALSGARVEDLLFVDIETTGLSSSLPLFLIGALRLDGEPRLDLFLARDYPEEQAVLAAFHRLAVGRTFITFNGKSFDWPYIEGRSTRYRLPFQKPRAHLDLLHYARRTWKHSVPNCKLQTLELYLCGRTRIDDVLGSQIPQTYHEFVATHAASGRGAHLMAPVIHHNALDILTMAELLCKASEDM
jgi:uncharacterized protein YprB with RNaseH-like and TPR domain